jgi:hypothetical protein
MKFFLLSASDEATLRRRKDQEQGDRLLGRPRKFALRTLRRCAIKKSGYSLRLFARLCLPALINKKRQHHQVLPF